MQFQDLMSSFLETQRSVMLAYLQGSAASDGAIAPAVSASTLPSQGAVAGPAPTEPTPALAAAPAAPVDASLEQDAVQLAGGETADLPSKEDLTRHLLFIVSERTGYPTEMLPMDEDIEARLGIDSIKRVEILGALQREYYPCRPAHRSRGHGAVDRYQDLAGSSRLVRRRPARRLGQPVASRNSGVQPARAEDEIEIARSRLVLVDAPAVMDRTLDVASGQVFLITDDGRGVAARVADQLRQCGSASCAVAGRGNGHTG